MAGLRAIPAIRSLGPKSKATVIPVAPVVNKMPGRPMKDLEMPIRAPRGPEIYRFGQKREDDSPVGQKPEDFPGTQPEWVWYVVSSWYHNSPKNPRNGNYTGDPLGKWEFSDPIGGGGVTAARDPSESVPDFTYYMPAGSRVIVRIEGFYFHIGMGAMVQARDLYLMQHLGSTIDRVVRVNDGDYMNDTTGQTAMKLLADALANRPLVGALQGGIVLPPRYADFL